MKTKNSGAPSAMKSRLNNGSDNGDVISGSEHRDSGEEGDMTYEDGSCFSSWQLQYSRKFALCEYLINALVLKSVTIFFSEWCPSKKESPPTAEHPHEPD